MADYRSLINYSAIIELREMRERQISRSHWQPLRRHLAELPLGEEIQKRRGEFSVSVNEPRVRIGRSGDLTGLEEEHLREAVKLLIPWRKGPFSLFGVEIDAEWRSDFKWQRLEPHLEQLKGRRVADIGCSNGYYMFRASGSEPECVIGIDPSEAFYYSFELFQRFVQNPTLQYELLGVEHMPLFPDFFDVVLCLGILYHHRNPLVLLQGIRDSLRPGGQLIVESQGIPGEEPVSLFAPERYAKARNVYFIPTAACLAAWVARAGFVDVEVCSAVTLTNDEQRRTDLAPYESLADFLSPDDPSKTIEGYPAPLRVMVKARKKDTNRCS